MLNEIDSSRLNGQHRECCALRGGGWGRKHSTVDYVFTYPPIYLYRYHMLVLVERKKRLFSVDGAWFIPRYRGQKLPMWTKEELGVYKGENPIYKEHDDAYLHECIRNLQSKGIPWYEN